MEPILKEYEETNQPFAQFISNYGLTNMDYETRRQYRYWKINTYFNNLEQQIEKAESKAEGKIEGIEEKAMEVAQKLFNANFSIEDIAEYTGLSIDAIEKLCNVSR